MVNIYCIFLVFGLIIDLFMILHLNVKLKNNRFNRVMNFVYFTLVFYFSGLILQLLFINSQIPQIYFDYITYIGANLLPVAIIFMALKYFNENIKIKRFYFLFLYQLFH